MLNHGTDVPELLAQLDRLTTTTKSVIKDTDKVVLECNVGDGIQSWIVRNGSCSLPDGAVVKKGTSFNGFQEAIETLDKGVYMRALLCPVPRFHKAGTGQQEHYFQLVLPVHGRRILRWERPAAQVRHHRTVPE